MGEKTQTHTHRVYPKEEKEFVFFFRMNSPHKALNTLAKGGCKDNTHKDELNAGKQRDFGSQQSR